MEIQGLLSGSKGTTASAPTLRLKAIPGPRFWAPRYPVVVFAAPPELARHLPGVAERVSPEPSADWPEIELPRVPGSSFRDILEDHVVSRFSAVSRSRHDDPARPIYVEWSAQLVPPRGGLPTEEEDFASNYLSSRFAPAAGSPDLTPRAAGNETVSEFAYRGRSLVSAHGAQVLHDRIVAYLNQRLGDGFPLGKNDDDERVRQRLHEAGVLDEPLVQTALRAWQAINNTKILCLPLGGFNDALLMRRQIVQLPIAESIGFPEYGRFSRELRDLVGQLPTSAPVPDAAFNPIRNGRLQLDRLRLIDSFGRTYVIAVAKDGVIAAEPLRSEAGVSFPPRFVQPMRVDFRWLSAGHQEMDSQSHPDTTPVCGWLLPNRLDESIAIYDAEGVGIGSIDVSGLWRPVPGDDHPVVPRDIGNPHLRRVVLQILAQARDGGYQKAFLQTINAALDAIDPNSFAAHPAISLLIGRPIAVVRASVRFELLGEPAEDHSWKLLDAQVAGKSVRRSRRFEDVEIPFRIGEHHMLNDGVVGYWIEDGPGRFEKNLFPCPAEGRAPAQGHCKPP